MSQTCSMPHSNILHRPRILLAVTEVSYCLALKSVGKVQLHKAGNLGLPQQFIASRKITEMWMVIVLGH